jgi:hypothetical protein
MATVIASKRARKRTAKKSERLQKADPEYSHKLFIILTKGSPQVAQTLRELIDAAFESIQVHAR